jgi:hypothetical protein
MRRVTAVLAAGLAAGALSIGLLVPAVADDTTPVEAGTREERRQDREAAFAAALAEELDLDVDRVAEAIASVREAMRAERQAGRQAAFEQRLADAVEAGDLTEEQVDAIREAHEAGVFHPRRHAGFDGRLHGRGFGPWSTPSGTDA